MNKITDIIIAQIMEVRDGGQCNMLDTTAVQRYAYEHGLFELTIFIEENRKVYAAFILRGECESE